MHENAKREYSMNDSLSIGFADEEKATSRQNFIGEVFDKITYPDGTVETFEKSFNIVVDSVSKLIAALIKNDSGYNGGKLYWALGTGASSWDTTPFSPVSTATRLTAEVFRKEITSKSFVDANGNKTASLTNRLQLDITIASGEANGHSLREFGIFGGNVSGAVNSGIMINHKAHSRIDKVEGMQIDRTVRFTF